ncbi:MULTISPECIES: hypothetical protein [Halomicrobium]|nr:MULTISPECIES: hypothetical protein [Halomicrobium]
MLVTVGANATVQNTVLDVDTRVDADATLHAGVHAFRQIEERWR